MKDRGISRRTQEVFDHVMGDHVRFAWWCGECRRRWIVNAAGVACVALIVFWIFLETIHAIALVEAR